MEKVTTNVIAFHIQNKKEHYARAFRYIMEGEKDSLDESAKQWEKQHVKRSLVVSWNNFRSILYAYEKDYKQGKATDNNTNGSSKIENKVYYFRIENFEEDDIVNLHYYFLAEKSCENKCCLSIQNLDIFKITDYLIFEMLKPENNPELLLVESDKKNNSWKYQYQLLILDKIFVLSIVNDEPSLFGLNSKNINFSGAFFPQLKIDRYLFNTFSMAAQEFCENIVKQAEIESSENIEFILHDLLFYIAEIARIKQPTNDSEIREFLNQRHSLKNIDLMELLELIMLHYCAKCYNGIINNNSSSIVRDALKKILSEFLIEAGAGSTILSICLFLSLIKDIPQGLNKEDTSNEEDLKNILNDYLIDSQDFASGILQLLENAVFHVLENINIPNGNGIFCFRLHKCGEGESANERLSSRYGDTYKTADGKYLELLISDFNRKTDIPDQFKANLSLKKEYKVTSDLENDLKSLCLKDFFDYGGPKSNIRRFWQRFYAEGNNITAHYGLLVFEHLVSFAEGQIRVFSSSDFTINNEKIYQNWGETESDKSNVIEPHLPGTQYEIVFPIKGTIKKSPSTGQYVEIKSIQKDYKLIEVSNNIIKKIIDEAINDAIKEAIKKETKEEIKEKIIDNYKRFIYGLFIKTEVVKKIQKKIEDYFDFYRTRNKISLKKLDKYVVLFDVSEINDLFKAEVFVKAIIGLLFDKNIDSYRYFAFVNCSTLFLSTFIRGFSILYMKTGQKERMAKRKIYLATREFDDEIYFSEKSIEDSYNITKEIVRGIRGKETYGLQILRRENEKATKNIKSTNTSTLPTKHRFEDIFEYLFFLDKALVDLKSDIQKKGFGCCLHNTHMRVGSKIHIHGDYFEASLLFGFSAYTSNFACYVADRSFPSVNEQIRKGKNKFVIVGYETYSEKLIICICDCLKALIKKKGNVDYVIYNEESSDNKFNRWNEVKPEIDQNTQFIIVVPVGSTLTTHDKIVADLLRTKLRDSNSKPNIVNVLMHHTIVLVRDIDKNNERDKKSNISKIEKFFWVSLNEYPINQTKWSGNAVTVEYKIEMGEIGAGNKIQCYLVVENEWLLPNECKYCFPKQDNLMVEEPLILTNRASVVPMTKIGIEHNYIPEKQILYQDFLGSTLLEDINKHEVLIEPLCYGHIVRDDNHFEYYFRTELLMKEILDNNNHVIDFKNWLSERCKKELINNSDCVCFDYVVAPLHNTNANFVHWVSKQLKAKQIIWLDVKREFRPNIKAKYSNLTSLYENSTKSPEKTFIRFHYVDDTINSGASFQRIKSVVMSLFPHNRVNQDNEDNNDNIVKIKVFQSVFLLLNRCSKDTQHNFIDDPDNHFHAYINPNTSSMRSYKDACVACNNQKYFSITIPKLSSTVSIASCSLDKAKRYEPREATNILHSYQTIQPNKEKKAENDGLFLNREKIRNFYRFLLTHRLNNMIYRLHTLDNEIIQDYIWKQLDEIATLPVKGEEDRQRQDDCFFSALKIISRPFLSFRKSFSQSAMGVLLHLADYTLNGNKEHLSNRESVKKFIDEFVGESIDKRIQFIKLLFSCLTTMRSTFLVRTSTMDAVLKIINSLKIESKEYEAEANIFLTEYVFYIKQILTHSGKENLSLWLEKALIDKWESKIITEPFPSGGTEIPYVIESDVKLDTYKLWQLLLIENTIPINDALGECHKAWKRISQENNNQNYSLIAQEMKPEMKKEIKDTLSHYFCKTYCEFSGIDINKNEQDFKKHFEEVFLPMFALYEQLDVDIKKRKDTSDVDTYYNNILENVKSLMGTSHPQLFTKILHKDKPSDDDIFLLYPAPERRDSKPKLKKQVEKIANDEIEGITSVGETFYYAKHLEENEREEKYFGVVKIVKNQNKLNKHDKPNPEYYLAFEWEPEITKEMDDLDVLLKARNLLAMRSRLTERITKDFDNNIRDDFIEIKKNVLLLSNDKTGSHTAFSVLEKQFKNTDELFSKLIQPNNMIKPKDVKDAQYYASQLRLIADSVVSKLYVHRIIKTIPKYLNPQEMSGDCSIIEYAPSLAFVNYGCIDDDTSIVFASELEKKGLNQNIWDNVEINFPGESYFIWCCCFIASYYNALRHGRVIEGEENKGERHVKVELSYHDEYIKMKNLRKIDDNDKKESHITIDALQYFFDTFYGKNKFFSDKDPDDNTYYLTKIPCKVKEENNHATDSNN